MSIKPDKTTIYKLLILLFAIVMSAITIINYKSHSFMYDELYTLSFVSKKISFADMMKIFMTDEVTNPPLYNIFLYYWYRIVPASEIWLLIPNIIFFLIGIFITGRLITKVSGHIEYSLLIMMIAWINGNSYLYMLYYLRSYAMLFMFSAVVLYMYHKTENSGKISDCILLGTFMTCVALTHYYGIFLVAAFGIYSFWIFIIKRRSLIFFIPYIISGVLTGIYLFAATLNRTKSLSSYWAGVPTLSSIVDVFNVFFVDKDVIAIFAFSVIVAFIIRFLLKNLKISGEELSLWQISIWCGFFVILIVYIYGRYVNPNGSIFISKYFLVIYPEMLLLYAFSLDIILEAIYGCIVSKLDIPEVIRNGFVSVSCFGICILTVISMFRWNIVGRVEDVFNLKPQNRLMAEFIKENIDENSAVLVYRKKDSQWDVPYYPVKGFKEFYLGEKYENINIVSEQSEINKYDKIYLWYTMFAPAIYNNSKNTVDEEVVADMSGFKLIKVNQAEGLIQFEKD